MQVYSPKQVARAIGASESSVKRWCDRGLLHSVKTAGGHRRVPLSGVLAFVRDKNHQLVVPEELGLPAGIGTATTSLAAAVDEFRQALYCGKYPICRRIMFDLILAGHSAGSILDSIVAPAMHSMGDEWCSGNVEIFEERRGCEITTRLIHDLRSMIGSPLPDGPVAIGASIEGDPYGLPTRMVELTLIDCGWNATSLGENVPLVSLKNAIVAHQPRLFWLSISTIADEEKFVSEYLDLFSICESVLVVLGGRGLTEPIRKRIEYTTYCENLERLESFVNAIHKPQES